MLDENNYEKEWQTLAIKERNLTIQLEDLDDEKRKLNAFEEDVMEKTQEGIYHVNQLLDRAVTPEEYRKRQNLMELFSNQATVLDAGFQDRRERLSKKEQVLNQDLDAIIVDKQKLYYQMEEFRQKKKEGADGKS